MLLWSSALDLGLVFAVARHLYFVGFGRHLEGEVTEVQLPLTLIGLLACPAYHKGDPTP